MAKPSKPYQEVDWNNLQYLPSLSHTHVRPQPEIGGDEERQPQLDLIYQQGIRHYAISNHASNSRDVEVLAEGRPLYPLKDYFSFVPADLLGCPNAEHRWKCGPEWVDYDGFKGHFCGLGSVFNSKYRFEETGITTWRQAFEEVIENYVYAVGGGIVVNHCGNIDFIVSALKQFPDDFLGMEICNGKRGEFFLAEWDMILEQGLQCFGFCNPDGFPQPENRYRNILLVPRCTEEEAIQAYRQGRFFGALKGSGLVFTEITMVNNNAVRVQTNQPAAITFITNEGQFAYNDIEAIFKRGANTRYLRIEAADSTGETIYSQPTLFQPGLFSQ